MVSIRFKLVWVALALLGAFVLVNDAKAFTINGDYYAWYGPGDDTGYIYCDSGALSPGDYSACVSDLSNFTNPGTGLTVVSTTGDNDTASGPGVPYVVTSSGTVSGDFRLYITGAGGYPATAAAYAATYSIDGIATPPPTSSNTTWGDNGVWGPAVTTDSIKSDLVASVQATGTNLWPMLIFLGIVLAFAIFGYLVTSIKDSVKPKTARRRSKTFDPVQFNRKADELSEFYSKTGGADPVMVEQIKKSVK